MPQKRPSPKRRSGCPLNASVEILGDRWSLLIIRDMMLRGSRTYKEFLESYEGIPTNILADRLGKLEANGIVPAEQFHELPAYQSDPPICTSRFLHRTPGIPCRFGILA